MSPQNEYGHERGSDGSTASVTDLNDRLDPIESAVPSDISRSTGAVPGFNASTAALVTGGVFSIWAIRALASRRLRALPYGAVGIALLVRGLTDIAGDTDAIPFEPGSEDGLEDDGSDGGGPVDADEGTVGVDDDVASDPRTTEDGVDVDRSATPSTDEATDPASTTQPGTAVDDPPSANEVSEATGPKPQQAEPTQTDATEPEATPPEDASPSTTTPTREETGDSGDATEERDPIDDSLGSDSDDEDADTAGG